MIKNGTVINRQQCDAKSLLLPAFCHHQFDFFPLLHLYSLSALSSPRNQFSFPPRLSLLTFLWAMHPQTPSDPFRLAWSLPLSHLVSGPSVNILLFLLLQLLPTTILLLPAPQMLCIFPLPYFAAEEKGRETYRESVREVQVLCPSLSGGCPGVRRRASGEVHPFEYQSSSSSLRQ